ncbi:hypothetical protein BJ322DRAFT_1221545 [Thelephora terrestris]|uniref:Uncharacterized protein n=1 Tax=Thelephora terrestris TaxID=56493 RepID=A0A9P6H558_9AGAM|nr:hypothetical protein BJ322DRAFT_1221545 [Thelephora terrestris]
MTVTLANPAGGPDGTHALSKIRLTKRAVWGALPIYTQPWGPLVSMSCYHSTTTFASHYRMVRSAPSKVLATLEHDVSALISSGVVIPNAKLTGDGDDKLVGSGSSRCRGGGGGGGGGGATGNYSNGHLASHPLSSPRIDDQTGVIPASRGQAIPPQCYRGGATVWRRWAHKTSGWTRTVSSNGRSKPPEAALQHPLRVRLPLTLGRFTSGTGVDLLSIGERGEQHSASLLVKRSSTEQSKPKHHRKVFDNKVKGHIWQSIPPATARSEFEGGVQPM